MPASPRPRRQQGAHRWSLVLLGSAVLCSILTGCGDKGEDRHSASTSAKRAPDSTTSTSATAPSPIVEDAEYRGHGPKVLILGDSLTVGSAPLLRRQLDDVSLRIYAYRGEGLSNGPWSKAAGKPIMPGLAATLAPTRPAVVVLALGTNDAWLEPLTVDAYRREWDRTTKTRFPDACIVGVTITETAKTPGYNRKEAKAINSIIRSGSDQIVDWNARGGKAPYLGDDEIHATPEGQTLRAKLIDEKVDACLTGR